jgi:hypothetical protein
MTEPSETRLHRMPPKIASLPKPFTHCLRAAQYLGDDGIYCEIPDQFRRLR